MAGFDKTELMNRLCRIMAGTEPEKSIPETFQLIGEEIGLEGVFVLHSGDIPLLLEVRDTWERNEHLGDRHLIFDFNDDEAWNLLNPFVEGGSFVVVEDIDKRGVSKTVAGIAHNLGIRSFVIAALCRNSDYLGSVVFYDVKTRKWKPEELGVFKEFPDILYNAVLRQRKDESQRYLLDEANRLVQSANEAKTQFLTKMSHEVRTPINALIGMTSIMRHNLENPEVVDQCLERIEKSSKQLMDLINDCVDEGCADNDDMLLNRSWITFTELCGDIYKMIGHLAEGRGQILRFDYDSSIRINADRAKLGRILTNLVSNSCKYSPDGSEITVVIRMEQVGGKHPLFTFRIRDNGMGMPEEVVRHVFDPGSDLTIPARGSGAGIGLMVTKHLIDMMHGTIDVSSGIGKGTEIVVGIHLETDQETVPKSIVDITEQDDTAELYVGRRILIAEDNVLMAEILATILGYRGLETDTAINGQEALDMYMKQDAFYYDMVFMDIQMPVMDGIKAARAIREGGKADSAIVPIIALSSNTFEEDAKQSLEAGMNAHLAKPVAEKELFDTIRQYML